MPSASENPASFHFDLSVIPFGRKNSLLTVLQENGQLYINRFTKDYPLLTHAAAEFHPKALRFWLGDGEEDISPLVTASPDLVEFGSSGISASCCFDGSSVIRFKGSGSGMTFLPGPTDENAEFTVLMDGSVLFSSYLEGEFLFVPLRGGLRLEEQRLTVLPEQNAFEFAVVFDLCQPMKPESFRDFEECRIENLDEFIAWYRQYPDTYDKYEELKRLCAYVVWTACTVLPNSRWGYIPLYCRFDSAFCWQGIYHAMGLVENPDEAVTIMLSIFQYQDSKGQLPDLVDDRNINFLSTKPPVQGFTFLNLKRRLGNKLNTSHFSRMYEPFSRWYRWWMNFRDTSGDGIPEYHQGCECSVDNSLMFSKGVPVEGPDLIAYMILLAESLQYMASRLGKKEDEQNWARECDRLLRTLETEFWNGECFVARLSESHEIVETDELDVYTPILLGERLSEPIRRKLIQDLKDPEKFMTPIGLRHAPASSSDFMRGVIGGFWEIKFAVALHDCGEIETAKHILEAYCKLNTRLGPSLGYHERDAIITENQARPAHRLGYYSALACGIYLASIALVREWDRELYQNS